jgi:hypothetical protein
MAGQRSAFGPECSCFLGLGSPIVAFQTLSIQNLSSDTSRHARPVATQAVSDDFFPNDLANLQLYRLKKGLDNSISVARPEGRRAPPENT